MLITTDGMLAIGTYTIQKAHRGLQITQNQVPDNSVNLLSQFIVLVYLPNLSSHFI